MRQMRQVAFDSGSPPAFRFRTGSELSLSLFSRSSSPPTSPPPQTQPHGPSIPQPNLPQSGPEITRLSLLLFLLFGPVVPHCLRASRVFGSTTLNNAARNHLCTRHLFDCELGRYRDVPGQRFFDHSPTQNRPRHELEKQFRPRSAAVALSSRLVARDTTTTLALNPISHALYLSLSLSPGNRPARSHATQSAHLSQWGST